MSSGSNVISCLVHVTKQGAKQSIFLHSLLLDYIQTIRRVPLVF